MTSVTFSWACDMNSLHHIVSLPTVCSSCPVLQDLHDPPAIQLCCSDTCWGQLGQHLSAPPLPVENHEPGLSAHFPPAPNLSALMTWSGGWAPWATNSYWTREWLSELTEDMEV